MKKTLFPLILITALLLTTGCFAKERVSVAFFFLETCPGCESYIHGEALKALVTTLDHSQKYQGESWNMAFGDEKGKDKLNMLIEEKGLPDISYALPLLFIGEEYFVGYEEIEQELNHHIQEITGK
jgi:hypothetical protein